MTAPVFDPVLNSRPRRLADLLKAGLDGSPNVPIANGLGAPTDYKLADIANADVNHSPQLREVSQDRHQRVLDVLRGVAGGLSEISDNNTGFGSFLRDAGRGYATTSDTVQGLAEHRQDRELEQEDRSAVAQERIRQMLRQNAQDDRQARLDASLIHDREADNAAQAGERAYQHNQDASQTKYRVGRDKVEDQHFRQNQGRLQSNAGDGESGDPTQRKSAYLRARIVTLTRDKTDPYDGTVINPGMDLPSARAQAEQEWNASEGGQVPAAPAAQPSKLGQLFPRDGGASQVTDADRQRAATDPGFAAFLQRKGLHP